MSYNQKLKGVYPILGTCFRGDEGIDYESQEQLIEYCIGSGVHGLVTLANAAEGHLMSESEKKELLSFVVKIVNKRIPVVVTINHPSTYCAGEWALYAQEVGASAVMCMPPFFGRWRSGLDEIDRFFRSINSIVAIPIIIQDHQLSDINLPVDFLIDLTTKYDNIRYLKLESGNIIHKAKKILAHPRNGYLGVFGGNSGVFLPEEFATGCCGTMPACYMPAEFRHTWDLLDSNDYDEAVAYFAPFSRLAAYEKDVANRCLWKEILFKKGIIKSAKVRSPEPSFFEEWEKEQLLKVAAAAGLNF